MSVDPVLEDLMSQLGDIGPYQFKQNLIQNLGAFLGAVHMYALTAVAPTPTHRCMIPQVDSTLNGTCPSFNISLLHDFIPLTADGELDQCQKYVSALDHNDEMVECNGTYVYDDTYYHSSRVIDMNLVCEKRWIRAILQSIYVFGVLASAIILGPLADKYGRKIIFYISGILQLIFGLASAFVGSIYVYAGVLFFYGTFSYGAYLTGFVLTIEIVGPSRRTLFGAANSLAYSFGVMVVALWAALISQAWLLQTILALHTIVLLFFGLFMDESIRWLWGQGRVTEAVEIAKNAVQSNRKEFINRYDGKDPFKGEKEKSHGITDLFKTPAMRCRMLTVTCLWMANSLVYWGLSLNTGSLVGNPFLMLFISGLVEVPACLLVLLLLDRTGRRSLCSTLFFIGGVACIASAFVHKGDILGTIFVMTGKFAITGSFAITYNYTAELFPTVVRTSAVGVGSMGARITGALTPLITLLASLDLRIPIVIFGVTSITAAALTLLLPETVNKELPQTLEDGERFGKGDTGYRSLCKMLSRVGRRKKNSGQKTTSDNCTSGFTQDHQASGHDP